MASIRLDERAGEQLHSFSWQRWLDREKEPLPENIQRRWSPIPDDWWPSIETSYQRYIHHARPGAARALEVPQCEG